MSLLVILGILIACGIIVWLVHMAPFLTPAWKRWISFAIGAVVVLWLLDAVFHIFSALGRVHV
jgi:hypothetical protein